MTTHLALIEVGPATVRQLCCGTGIVADAEMSAAALGAIDDELALVDERPVAVEALWGAVLRSVDCGSREGVVVVHPSWWPASRVGVVTAGAREVTKNIVAQPRSWLLKEAAPNSLPDAAVVVEIADRIVTIAGARVSALPRRIKPHPLAEEVAGVIAEMTRGATVVIDGPSTVAGAPQLAKSIAGAVRDSGRTVVEIDDARLARLAEAVQARRNEPAEPPVPRSTSASRARMPARFAGSGVVLAALVAGMVAAVVVLGRHDVAPAPLQAPTTVLVEGRVALTVPADWPTQRVVAGPGSARVQLTSPSDPEVALHVTQSPVAGETLSDTAERLRRAMGAEPAGVFVDFNPGGFSAGRAAVTYREIRAAHQVRWTVLLDGAVRISVGCQSGPGGEGAVRGVCEQAVRSAHAVG